ncbi:hypothetical protein KUTeg_013359 [Tegillarca granosa]|uniref:Uncharacterized protein n=1 Tax=Tegillarca granosa TaxID=220873 RepID=A0ABQ9EXF8_TEGGR|nr:hypothetical protein KUTeg_013359 [Tegillarca granosa]
MAGWNSSSTFLKIALICLSLGLVLFVIGFATNSWVSGWTYHRYQLTFGLWKYHYCPPRAYCSTQKITSIYLTSQGMEAIKTLKIRKMFENNEIILA